MLGEYMREREKVKVGKQKQKGGKRNLTILKSVNIITVIRLSNKRI